MEGKQLIIAIGREYGSGGHEIAQRLAEHYKLPLYDRNLLEEVMSSKGLPGGELIHYDEKNKRNGIYRSVRGMDSSPEVVVAKMQFDFLKQKAKNGESFVVVGRCAETVLKEFPALISIFVLGDQQEKLNRIMRLFNISSDEAKKLMNEKDNKRKKYHNTYCEIKWGDSRNYEISINSSKIGVDKSTDILIDYIEARKQG